MPANSAVLCAWLRDVDEHGRSRPAWPSAPQPKTVHPGGVLHVSVEGGQDSPTHRYLKTPPAEGMASEPVTVGLDAETGYWTIRNSGHTNTLRVQQYGLSAVPLAPPGSHADDRAGRRGVDPGRAAGSAGASRAKPSGC